MRYESSPEKETHMTEAAEKDALVLFMPSGKRGRFPLGMPVLDAARKLGVYVESVCGGRATCGRCQISVQEGNFAKHQIVSSNDHLSPVGAKEERYDKVRGLPEGRRLSCSALIQGDLVIDVPQDTVINAQTIRKDADTRVIARDTAIRMCYVEIEEPDMHKPLGDLDRMKAILEKDWGWKNLLIAPHIVPEVQSTLRKGNWGVTAAIHRDMDSSRPFIVSLWPGLKNEAYGIACDIGSTTIAMHLVSLLSGRIVASSGTSNPQIRFGEDLMSRVSYVMMNPDGREAMTSAVREAVNMLIGKVCAEGGVDRHDILDLVFVANPIMHHLFLGIDPTELGQAPFALAVSGAMQYWAHELDIDVNRGARTYLLPCIAGHVGADAAGATLAEGPYRQDGMMLLVDVGFARYGSKAEAVGAMKAAAAKAKPGEWLAFGFYDNLLQGGDFSMAELDAVSTANPIFLLYVNGHVGCANTLAFQRAGVTEATGDLPGGGFFGRGADGRLNGLIYNEPALLKFLDIAVPKPTPEDLARAVSTYAKQAAAAGLTTLHEPGTVKPEWVKMLAELSKSLPIRYSASFSTDMVEASKAFASLGPSDRARVLPGSRFSLYGMKYWGDGSNQAETAAQTEPYLGTDKRGSLGYTNAEAIELCTKAKGAGWTILVHSQGDAAVDQILDAIETVYGAHPASGLNRVEHATMARADQIERMKRLGCEPSFMTDFVHLYGADYRDKLFGPERAAFMVPVGAAAKAGIGYSLHTDNPAAGLPLNPMRLVETAVTRRCMTDGSVIGPDLAVTVDQALRGITLYAARQLGMGDRIGSLEVGKEADFTLLESDPYATDPGQLSAIKVSETWVEGARVQP